MSRSDNPAAISRYVPSTGHAVRREYGMLPYEMTSGKHTATIIRRSARQRLSNPNESYWSHRWTTAPGYGSTIHRVSGRSPNKVWAYTPRSQPITSLPTEADFFSVLQSQTDGTALLSSYLPWSTDLFILFYTRAWNWTCSTTSSSCPISARKKIPNGNGEILYNWPVPTNAIRVPTTPPYARHLSPNVSAPYVPSRNRASHHVGSSSFRIHRTTTRRLRSAWLCYVEMSVPVPHENTSILLPQQRWNLHWDEGVGSDPSNRFPTTMQTVNNHSPVRVSTDDV